MKEPDGVNLLPASANNAVTTAAGFNGAARAG
jgi:hypothetical protein